MSTPAPTRHATAVPTRWRRAVVLVVGAGLAVHSVLVTVWVMPANPLREAIGPERLERYIDNGVLPFEQDWSVFAPIPRRVGESVQVRAHVAGTGTTTDWYDITAEEEERARHRINPSRIHAVTRRLGGSLNELLANFNDEQRRIVTAGRASRDRLAEDLRRAGRDNDDDDVARYLRTEEMLTRFGTMYATARWGDGVDQVQFRIGQRRVPAFDRRDRAAFGDAPFTYRTLGWRPVMPGGAVAQEAFDAYVDRASGGTDR